MFARSLRPLPADQLDTNDGEKLFRHWRYPQSEAHTMVIATAYRHPTDSRQGWPQQRRYNVTLYQQLRSHYATTVAAGPHW